jgi:hypothetical protein
MMLFLLPRLTRANQKLAGTRSAPLTVVFHSNDVFSFHSTEIAAEETTDGGADREWRYAEMPEVLAGLPGVLKLKASRSQGSRGAFPPVKQPDESTKMGARATLVLV